MSWWISLISLVVCLQAAFEPSKARKPPLCGLDGYDIPLLYQALYWTFTFDEKRECPVPLHGSIREVKSCKMHFAICQPLNITVCEGYDNSSLCIEVTLNNNTKLFYNIGTHTAYTEFLPIGKSDVDGFYALIEGSKFGSNQCENHTAATLITFKCDESIKWDPNGTRDVTSYVITAAQLPNDPCFYDIQLKYSGACYTPPTLQPSLCYLDDYDVKTLALHEFWTAEVSPSLCIGQHHISCTFLLAFCHDITPIVGAGCYGSSVCQIGELPNDKVVEYSMGKFVSNKTRFIENVDGIGGGFHMDVQNGSKPESLTNINCNEHGIRTRVVLKCNSSAVWKESNITDFIRVAYNEWEDPCTYTLELDYAGACVPVFPTANGTDSTLFLCDGIPHRHVYVPIIVVGAFVGVLAIAVIMYLAIGSAYQFFVKQEGGIRIFPNYDFWKKLLTRLFPTSTYKLAGSNTKKTVHEDSSSATVAVLVEDSSDCQVEEKVLLKNEHS